MKHYDYDSVDPLTMKKLKIQIEALPEIAAVMNISKAAAGLFAWVLAVYEMSSLESDSQEETRV
jgi:hypothetical protein